MAKATVTSKRRKRAAHKNGEVNKAEAIREVASSMGGKVRPKDIIATLAEKGITVSSPQVSATLKAAGFRRSKRRGRASTSAAATAHAADKNGEGLPSLNQLLAAKALIAKIGSVEAARKALEVLAKLS